MSVPHKDSYNASLSSVPQMQSPSPLFQFGQLALPIQEAAERQQFRSWMLHQLHNTPVEKSRNTIRQYMYDMICSKTQHADKASKISGMILAQYHGDVDLIDEYVRYDERHWCIPNKVRRGYFYVEMCAKLKLRHLV